MSPCQAVYSSLSFLEGMLSLAVGGLIYEIEQWNYSD